MNQINPKQAVERKMKQNPTIPKVNHRVMKNQILKMKKKKKKKARLKRTKKKNRKLLGRK